MFLANKQNSVNDEFYACTKPDLEVEAKMQSMEYIRLHKQAVASW